MRYEELKKSLINKIETGYILYGSDSFLLNNSIKVITDACKLELPEFNFIKFNDENFNIDEVISSLEMLPIMSERKVVLLDFSNNLPKVKFDGLIEYFKNPNTTSVFILNIGENELKSIPLNIQNVDCNPIAKEIAIKFIANEIKKYGKTAGSEVVYSIFENCKGDLNNSIKEINKLCNYVGSNSEITINDVNELCDEFKEYQIFELTENLANKNSSKVFEILYLFKKNKEQGRGLFGLISNHFRRLFFVSVTGTDVKELSKLLEIKEFAVQKCIKQAKYFTKKQLKAINDKCSELDFQIKQSLTNFETGLDLLVLFILNLK